MIKPILSLAILLFLAACGGDDKPPSVTIPITSTGEPYITTPPPSGVWSFQYSKGVPLMLPIGEKGGFSFTFPASDGAHYLVRNWSSTVSKLRVQYTITGDNPTWNHHADDCGAAIGGTVVFYLQKAGDTGLDMSGRWFTWPIKVDLALGEKTVEATTSDDAKWSNVNGQRQSQSGFSLPSMVAMAVGVTFGGGCAAGHGTWVTPGSAMMNADLFEIQ